MDISIVFSFLSLKYLQFDKGIFCRVRRLAWCDDPESYAGGSVATGRATLAGQVKGDAPRQREIHWSSRLGVGSMGQHPITRKKTHMLKNLDKGSGAMESRCRTT